jgi:hypothetical protein
VHLDQYRTEKLKRRANCSTINTHGPAWRGGVTGRPRAAGG